MVGASDLLIAIPKNLFVGEGAMLVVKNNVQQ
jgi:hypothetical protein